MKPPIFVRPLTDAERSRLEAGLRSSDAFVLRRCQILLASARREWPPAIARVVGCDDQTVRTVIRQFEQQGLDACLTRCSTCPHHPRTKVDATAAARLEELLHQSPRQFAKPTSVWTLDLAADVCCEQGITAERVSDETIRQALLRLGKSWKRAKHWITSPDPEYLRKKGGAWLIRLAATHPQWVLGYQDETWWSRLKQPMLSTWTDEPVRLVEQTVAKADPDPKALACYGLLRNDTGRVLLRFVDGQPRSPATIAFLDWCDEQLAADGKRGLLLVWDNASWHLSHAVGAWLSEHNHQVKRDGKGVRIVSCFLPIKSPWLNPIEPHWAHGKRHIVEPARLLTAQELEDRVHAHFGCSSQPHILIPEHAA